jgi:hypothetical protein
VPSLLQGFARHGAVIKTAALFVISSEQTNTQPENTLENAVKQHLFLK